MFNVFVKMRIPTCFFPEQYLIIDNVFINVLYFFAGPDDSVCLLPVPVISSELPDRLNYVAKILYVAFKKGTQL